jgi:group I intron endonuclease
MGSSGVYAIIHRDSGRWYVGQSQDPRKRWNGHRCHLRRGTHHCAPLQYAWAKYGEDAFSFEVLILAPVWVLDALEQAYLDDPDTSHFNVARDAVSPMRGRKLSEDQREARKRRRHSPETIAKMRASHARALEDPEYRAKLGRPRTPEEIEKAASAHRGRKHKPESIAKMRAAKTGQKHTPESRSKLSAALKGKNTGPKSEEHKAKIAASLKGREGRKQSPETIAKRLATFAAKRALRKRLPDP